MKSKKSDDDDDEDLFFNSTHQWMEGYLNEQQQKARVRRSQKIRGTSQNTTAWKPELTGRRVTSLSQLRNLQDYILIPINSSEDIVFVIREKRQPRQVTNLPVRDFAYEITILRAPYILPITFQTLDEGIGGILQFMYNELHSQYGSQNSYISLELLHHTADAQSFPSQLHQFTKEGGISAVIEILEALHAFIQSIAPLEEFSTLEFKATIIKDVLEGEGILREKPPKRLRRLILDECEYLIKRMSRNQPQGSILYVNCKEKCMYVAAYFAMAYHLVMERYDADLQKTMTPQNHQEYLKETAEWFWKVLEEENEEQVIANAANFFADFNLDIHNYGHLHEEFLQDLSCKFDVQISVHDASKQLRRTFITPPMYDPLLPQLCLLRCTAPANLPKKMRYQDESFHFHGLRGNATAIAGRDIALCCYCGKAFSQHSTRHMCQDKKMKQCKLCLRPVVDQTVYLTLSHQAKFDHCIQHIKKAELQCHLCQAKYVVHSFLCFPYLILIFTQHFLFFD